MQPVSDPKALIRVERTDNGFKITCQSGTLGKALVYDPGLQEGSWRTSNALMDEKGLEAEFVCPTPLQSSMGNATGAFVLKTRGYWVRATLSLLSAIRDDDFGFYFDLSRDNVFVNESQDAE